MEIGRDDTGGSHGSVWWQTWFHIDDMWVKLVALCGVCNVMMFNLSIG